MNSNNINGYVNKADTNIIELILVNKKVKNKLKSLGFLKDIESERLIAKTNNDSEKAEIFNALRNLDIAFSHGKEWCPAEVFEYFRDIGLLTGSFQRIQWKGPDDFYITSA